MWTENWSCLVMIYPERSRQYRKRVYTSLEICNEQYVSLEDTTHVPREIKQLPKSRRIKRMSLKQFAYIFILDVDLFVAAPGGRRDVTVPTAIAQQAKHMHPDIRTAFAKPTLSKSRWSIMGNTTPPIE